jgi:hypothetical protein
MVRAFRQSSHSAVLGAALLSLPLLAAQPAASFHEGDRSYLRATATLRKEPDEKSAAVAELLAGDEVAVQEPEENPFHDPPTDWVPVATTEVPSHRLFSGWVRVDQLAADPPKDFERAALLRQFVEERLAELDARRPAFAALKDQAVHWRTVANGERQARELGNKLAAYMADEVTPRALDAIDRLDQLRALAEPHAGALSKKLDELSKGFQP